MAQKTPLTNYEKRLLEEQESKKRIRKIMSKQNEAPFGKPFDNGVSSLTTKVVQFFKQKSFFGFETFEKTEEKIHNKNKFNNYNNSRFKGDYNLDAVAEFQKKKTVKKESFWSKLFKF